MPVRTGGGAGRVLLVCPGGLEHGGGIGRQMGYFLQTGAVREGRIEYRVVDPRGRWFLGGARGRTVLALGALAGAMGTLLGARASWVRTVVHVNIAGRGSTYRKMALAALAHAIGLRYVLHVHDYDYAADFRSRGAVMRRVVRTGFGRAAGVLVLGERDRAALTDALKLDPGRVWVLPNAVPDPGAGAVDDGAGEACRLLFLGHLSDRKGVPELIEALARPRLRALPWRLTLAGGGEVAAYRRMAADHGIAERLDFAGWVDRSRVGALCRQAQVLVLPSHAEGLSMAVLEGLSHGMAVIATPVGAHAEVIEDEVSGLLVAPGDVAALEAALLEVIGDAGVRDRLRQGARARYSSAFDVAQYAVQLCGIHALVLEDAAPAR